MYVTLRMPASAARQLNLAANDGQEEVTVRLTPMELAGRLTVSTGQVVRPESVARYCRASLAARAAYQGIVNRYGLADLAEALRGACAQRHMWVPEDDHGTAAWLYLVLQAHLMAVELGSRLTAAAVYAWAYQLTFARLAELCKENSTVAYGWWCQSETGGPPKLMGVVSVSETVPSRERS